MTEPGFITPVRLCCGQRHWGVICPDGRVMCCHCFDKFEQDDLSVGEDGIKHDVCKPCWASDQVAVARQLAAPDADMLCTVCHVWEPTHKDDFRLTQHEIDVLTKGERQKLRQQRREAEF